MTERHAKKKSRPGTCISCVVSQAVCLNSLANKYSLHFSDFFGVFLAVASLYGNTSIFGARCSKRNIFWEPKITRIAVEFRAKTSDQVLFSWKMERENN